MTCIDEVRDMLSEYAGDLQVLVCGGGLSIEDGDGNECGFIPITE